MISLFIIYCLFGLVLLFSFFCDFTDDPIVRITHIETFTYLIISYRFGTIETSLPTQVTICIDRTCVVIAPPSKGAYSAEWCQLPYTIVTLVTEIVVVLITSLLLLCRIFDKYALCWII